MPTRITIHDLEVWINRLRKAGQEAFPGTWDGLNAGITIPDSPMTDPEFYIQCSDLRGRVGGHDFHVKLSVLAEELEDGLEGEELVKVLAEALEREYEAQAKRWEEAQERRREEERRRRSGVALSGTLQRMGERVLDDDFSEQDKLLLEAGAKSLLATIERSKKPPKTDGPTTVSMRPDAEGGPDA